ncbi:hypothetical protein I3842_15G101000 [Carya illinoinensis]|uniref:Uncharacterized protein n=1 Tax=Carya illinoinensis TaxID=32201 RepID=A0A922D229_CARIL|nr:hypothetical protein I3842_15G101000 [Carya illinoinensis]
MAPKILGHHREGVTALAISPNSTCLASGPVDHSVKLSGGMLAAAGDDEGIKLINTIDGSIARVLKGHKGPVTGLAFDPNSEYLASIDLTGSVIYWELHSGRTLHTLKGIAPDTALRNDVVMYDRDTSEKLFSLTGDHIQPICFLSWSPNVKYLATSGLDKQVLIWDFDRKKDIDRHKFNETICCMAWKPVGNALAVIYVMGKYGVWESIVPLSMKSPSEDGLSASGSLSDLGEDGHGESEPSKRKRLRKQSAYEENFDKDGSDEWSLTPKVESRKKVSHFHKEAFQPGATPVQPGKRHFLCYNMAGSITTIEHNGYSHIEYEACIVLGGPMFCTNIPSMTDHFGFTMAALNDNGSVFANPCKGKKNMSTLTYRPFSTWENNMMPKPVLTLLNISFPLASSDLGAEALENEIEEMTGAGLDTTSLDEACLEVAQDRCILRLIASCCNGDDKLVRATELVKLISMEKSMKGAIKLPLPNSMADARMMADIAVGKTLTSAETSETSETVIPLLSPKLTAPLFTKKAKSQEVAKVGTKKAEHDQTPVLGELGKEKRKEDRGDKSSGELRKAGETSQVQPNRSSNPFVKSSNKKEMTKLGENQAQSPRPSNPFMKSSIK